MAGKKGPLVVSADEVVPAQSSRTKKYASGKDNLGRRTAVYRLYLQGHEPYQIVGILQKKADDAGRNRIYTVNQVRRDIESMQDRGRNQVMVADPWGEIGEHAACFEIIARVAMAEAMKAATTRERAEMMRVALSARNDLVALQTSVGILPKAAPKANRPDIVDLPRFDEPVDLNRMSTEELYELLHDLGSDPDIQKYIESNGDTDNDETAD